MTMLCARNLRAFLLIICGIMSCHGRFLQKKVIHHDDLHKVNQQPKFCLKLSENF